MSGRQKKEKMVYHHIVADTQGGSDKSWNRLYWVQIIEICWHALFGSLLPSACIVLIKSWMETDGYLDEKRMTRRDIELFRGIFGHTNCLEAIKFVEDKFLPAEKRFFKEGADKRKQTNT